MFADILSWFLILTGSVFLLIGAVEAVANANHVVATVVLVVPSEDMQFVVQRDVVDVPQPVGEHVQIGAIGPAAQNPALLKQQSIALRSYYVATTIAQREI